HPLNSLQNTGFVISSPTGEIIRTGGHSLLGRRSVVGISVSRESSLSKSYTNAVRRGRYISRTLDRGAVNNVLNTDRASGVVKRTSSLRPAAEAAFARAFARACASRDASLPASPSCPSPSWSPSSSPSFFLVISL
ncbi:hypothetical protein Vafri_10816, partial [Volvox africanus]